MNTLMERQDHVIRVFLKGDLQRGCSQSVGICSWSRWQALQQAESGFL